MAYREKALTNQADWLRFKAFVVVITYSILSEVGWTVVCFIREIAVRLEVAVSFGKLVYSPEKAAMAYQSGVVLAGAIGFAYGLVKAGSLFLEAAKLEWMAQVADHLKAIRENGYADQHKQLPERPN